MTHRTVVLAILHNDDNLQYISIKMLLRNNIFIYMDKDDELRPVQLL
jgi:hypothetical protein